MKTFNVEIEGTSALLSHRFNESSEQAKSSRKVLIIKETPRVAAERVAYIDTKGNYYFPGGAITKMVADAGSNHKMTGTRKSAKYVVPSALRITEMGVTVLNGDGKPAKDFEVDSRSVVIPSTKGRVMRHRPRFDVWGARFTLRINEDLMDPQMIHQMLVEGGQEIGIGDFRPQKGGPFGTFNVVSWSEHKAA